MDKYKTLRQLGDGTYGSVNLGRSIESGEYVAIKKMKKKFYSWEECMNLREVKSLKKLKHANVVKLKEVIRENDCLYFVFEYMKENLYQLMKERTRLFPESDVRNMTFQILQGLAFIHKHGFFHRDLKPENLLCMGPQLVKIADFGLAREIRSRPPYTDYVSTRWYRAPEVLLRSTAYSSPIDLWAVGCIMAELYTLRPLFPGSSEIDTIFKICQVLGTPRRNDWPEGYQLSSAMGFRWPQCVPTSLRSLISSASLEGTYVMRDLLQWDPKRRPSASQALRCSFFDVGQAVGAPQQIQDQLHPQPPQPQHQHPPPQFRHVPAPPPQPRSQSPSQAKRPLQQIQPPSALLAQGHTAALVPDPSICTGKQREQPQQVVTKSGEDERDRGLQTRFPLLRDKGIRQQEPQNGNFSSLPSQSKTGRRRWGQASTTFRSEEWGDYEDGKTTITLLGKTGVSSGRRKQSEDATSRLRNVPNSISTVGKTDISTSWDTILGYQDHSRNASAKQHYLNQSRYLPGINSKKNVSIISNRDVAGGSLWGTGTIPIGGTLPLRGQHGGNVLPSGYVPSFHKKESSPTNPRVQVAPVSDSKAPNYATWRSGRSHSGSASYTSTPVKSSAVPCTRPSVHPVHGRTDWSAKYGHR